MSYIVIGRVIQNNIIVGLKLIDTQYYNYYWLEKKNFSLFFNSNDVLNCKLRSGKVYSKLSWLKMQDLAEFSNQGYMTGVGVYSDIYLVATILLQSEDLVGVKICGAICGAIIDEFSDEAERHAYMYYQEIREMSTDIQRIAKFTGIDEKIIAEIKNYVFMEYHELETGYRRFDPCFSMAVSWQRLLLGRCLSHDITLLKHEYEELNLVKQGLTCSQAHELAQIIIRRLKSIMLKATNIRINGNMILCTVLGTGFEIELQLIIGDWNNITVSDKEYYMEGCLVRNRIHRLYDEKNGKLPDSFSLYFG